MSGKPRVKKDQEIVRGKAMFFFLVESPAGGGAE